MHYIFTCNILHEYLLEVLKFAKFIFIKLDISSVPASLLP